MHFGTHSLVYRANMHLKTCADTLGARSLLHELFCITLPLKLDETQVCRAERLVWVPQFPKKKKGYSHMNIYLFI